MPSSFVIVGAGPSGFYAADALLRSRADSRVDILDRLPVPFGLVRYGVAPDHQGTKAVARQFERLLDKPGVRFLGGVELGRDVSLAELRGAYDGVILAVGATQDRPLGIPGDDLDGVLGSGAFTRWCNAHPDAPELSAQVARARRIAVIGAGNVAIDVARLFAKSADELAKSDLDARAATALAAAPVEEVRIVGRRGPVDAAFTLAELSELGRLARASASVEAGDLGAAPPESDPTPEKLRKSKNLETMRGFAASASAGKPVALRLLFGAAPVAIRGDAGRVGALDVRIDGAVRTLPVDLVVSAIGYSIAGGVAGVALRDGRIAADSRGLVESAPGVAVVGWARRGPSGTIPTNRADSFAVAETLLASLRAEGDKPGPAALDALLAARGVRTVDTAGWRRIDAAETAAGAARGRPRAKFSSWEALRAAANSG